MGGPTVDAATIDVESQRLLLRVGGSLGHRGTCHHLVTAAQHPPGDHYFGSRHLQHGRRTLDALLHRRQHESGHDHVATAGVRVECFGSYSPGQLLPRRVGRTTEVRRPLQALRDGWRPCLLASATTAVGLLSLAVSEIVPVKMFGIYAAAGMCGSLVTVLMLLPVALSIWPPINAGAARRPTTSCRSTIEPPGRLDLPPRQNDRHPCLWPSWSSPDGAADAEVDCQTAVSFRSAQAESCRTIAGWRSILGPLVPLELVVHFDNTTQQSILEQLQRVREFEHLVHGIARCRCGVVGRRFRATLFGTANQYAHRHRRVMMNNAKASRLNRSFARAASARSASSPKRLWRISVRASALSDIDYGRFVDELREEHRSLDVKEIRRRSHHLHGSHSTDL